MTDPAFATAEGLRLLLLDLAYAGRRAWQISPEAADLMTYTMEKYAGLSHKYGMEPTDAAAAAFEVMRMRSTRVAEDPWAVITHAVELTLIYDSRADGMLCSTGQARKTAGLDFHDAERFCDLDAEGAAIADYHPAFHFYATMADPYAEPPDEPEAEPTNAFFALDKVVEFFVDLGWPPNSARLGMEYIAARLSRCGKPEIAYKSLLREGDGPGFLDIGQRAWIDVLRAVLGDAHPDFAGTTRSRGLLKQAAMGIPVTELFDDQGLVDMVEAAAPHVASEPGETYV
jgi:hypothetical protein